MDPVMNASLHIWPNDTFAALISWIPLLRRARPPQEFMKAVNSDNWNQVSVLWSLIPNLLIYVCTSKIWFFTIIPTLTRFIPIFSNFYSVWDRRGGHLLGGMTFSYKNTLVSNNPNMKEPNNTGCRLSSFRLFIFALE